MPFQYRRMRAEDVPRCATILENDASCINHYGDSISGLRDVLRQFISMESARTLVYEVATISEVRFVGFGISIFISDAFAERLITPPFVWIGPEVVRRMKKGENPLLSNQDLRKLNADGGLNLAAFTAWVQPECLADVELVSGMMDAFLDEHQGYRIKQMFPLNEYAEFIKIIFAGGGVYMKSESSFSDALDKAPDEFVKEPHCFRVIREMVRPGTWISKLFSYQEPRIFFSPSEQRLLCAALAGRSDEDLSEELHISLSGVKKTWRKIYERVGDASPEVIGTDGREDALSVVRGKGKRQELLEYLRHHPEEMRPLLRKRRAFPSDIA